MNHFNNTLSYRQATTACVTLLKSFFAGSSSATLISTPVFNVTSNRVTIQLFYYSSTSAKSNITDKALKTLAVLVTRLYPANVTVDLQIVRLYQPYLNASILAQYIAINASKYGFHRIMTILLNAVPYASVGNIDPLA